MNKVSRLVLMGLGISVLLASAGLARELISYRIDRSAHRIVPNHGTAIQLPSLAGVTRSLFWEGLGKLVTLANKRDHDREQYVRTIVGRGASRRVQALVLNQLLALRLEGLASVGSLDSSTVRFTFKASHGGTYVFDYLHETDGSGRFYNDEIECDGRD